MTGRNRISTDRGAWTTMTGVGRLAVALIWLLAGSGALAQPVAEPGCDPKPLSAIGTAITSAIDADNQTPTSSSILTRCNTFVEAPFPDGWILDSPHNWGIPPQAGVPHGGHAFMERVRQEIAATESTLDLSALHIHKDISHDYLIPGLKELSTRMAVERPDGPYPVVRFLVGLSGNRPFYIGETPRDLLDDVKEALGDDRHIHFAAAHLRFLTGWSHTKYVVRDDQYAITGGHILHPDPVSTEDPMADLSIALQGEAAAATRTHFEQSWEHARRKLCTWSSWPITNCDDEPVAPPSPLPPAVEPRNVFSLSRSLILALPGDDSADQAVIAAFGAATDHIYLAQPRIDFCPIDVCVVADVLHDLVVDALLRGVRVHIIVGEDRNADAARRQYQILSDDLEEAALDLGLGTTERQAAHCRLKFGEFYNYVPELGALPVHLKNHAKFYAIDRQAFYVGSQNLYPSGFISTASSFLLPEHREHGFLVDDAELAAQMEDTYWAPLWQYSKEHLLPSPYLDDIDCGDVLPGEPEVCDGTDNDGDGVIDEGGVCGCTTAGYGGHSYLICDTPVPWDDARGACMARGGDLVQVDDADENAWLDGIDGSSDRWLGLTDAALEGVWRWVDGSLASSGFTRWSKHEPNGGTSENCANLWNGGTWNDLPCQWTVPFVCESDQVGQRACVTGNLIYDDFHQCLTGPVTVPLELLEEVDGDWLPVGTVQPDADGRFCADLDWGPFYRLQHFDDTCEPHVRRCEAVLRRQDLTAVDSCSERDPDCEELGDLDFYCES